MEDEVGGIFEKQVNGKLALNGAISAQGEEHSDKWTLIVANNEVTSQHEETDELDELDDEDE